MRTLALLLLFAILGAWCQTLSQISALQCTSNDMQVVGKGVVVNEPCGCSGTFTANVSFVINDNAASDRYCATIYFCDGNNFRQLLIPAVVPGKTSNTYSVQIPNYPCGSGLRCYGSIPPSGVLGDVFPKGAACPTGECCGTITWNVNTNDACPSSTPIASKCRHQQICIQGKQVSLTCAGNCNPQSVCGPYIATLTMCASGLAAGPYYYYVSDGLLAYTRTSSNVCESFQVQVNQLNASFTGYVSDSTGCKTMANNGASVSLTSVPSLALSLGTFAQLGCGPSGTFTATATGGHPGASLAYSFSVDNGTPSASSSGVFTYSGTPDGAAHTVSASVRDSYGCTAGPVIRTVSQCITATSQ